MEQKQNISMDPQQITAHIHDIAVELVKQSGLNERHVLVIGASTSEVVGKHIGTAGAEQIAQAIYEGLQKVQQMYSFSLAFQCCEHLNRAIVVSKKTLQHIDSEEVMAVPVPKAGGSMAAWAYRHMDDACLVESIQADAGIDIGETLIGMHLRRVAVPFRPSIRFVGHARIVCAYTRPKLIGGARAQYVVTDQNVDQNCE
ncbi:TIGR01440 family protein [Longirhabdus pacifica]|uniref:TIGR01440 family protein n=1 Tax=Longirhabdus pacifica TaxID=2305227 RepID=UPI001F0CB162|nr:TIGR01440 family protein [Longirhabdus pacifica]